MTLERDLTERRMTMSFPHRERRGTTTGTTGMTGYHARGSNQVNPGLVS